MIDPLGHLHITYLEATHIENNEIIKEAKSVSKWAASVAMAKLFAQIPPTISSTMKNRHKILAKISRFRAFLSIPPSRSPVWQCRSVVVQIVRNVIDFCPHFSTKIFLYYKLFNLFPCEIWRKISVNNMYTLYS